MIPQSNGYTEPLQPSFDPKLLKANGKLPKLQDPKKIHNGSKLDSA
jgi:hypothetical protein